MAPQAKLCPSCQTPAPLDAIQCGKCGHKFRTKFLPDPPTVAFSPPRVAPLPPPPSARPVDHIAGLNWSVIAVVGLVGVVVCILTIGLLAGGGGPKLTGSERARVAAWLATKDGLYLNSEIDSVDTEITQKADAVDFYRHELIKVEKGMAEMFTADSTRDRSSIIWKPGHLGRIEGDTWLGPSRRVQFVVDSQGILTADAKRYYKIPAAPLNNFEAILAPNFRKKVIAGEDPGIDLRVMDG